jgi:hypothetical protein
MNSSGMGAAAMSARGAGEMFRISFASLTCTYDRAELQDQKGSES